MITLEKKDDCGTFRNLKRARCKINSRIMNQESKWNFIQNLAKLIILNNSFCRRCWSIEVKESF